MVFENIGVGESLATLSANKGPFIGVRALMAESPAIVDIGSLTETTGKLAISSVHYLVTL